VHNIFSLSDAQSFDLGTFAKGETRKVKMEKEGQVEIECAVHPEMKMVVEVKK
jgi:plastocyanin